MDLMHTNDIIHCFRVYYACRAKYPKGYDASVHAS